MLTKKKLKRLLGKVFLQTPNWAPISAFLMCWVIDKLPEFTASMWMLIIALLLLDVYSILKRRELKRKRKSRSKRK